MLRQGVSRVLSRSIFPQQSYRRSIVPVQKAYFSGGGYGSDDENNKEEFESDKRFSNFVLFVGAMALGGAFMYSNVMSMQKAKQRTENEEKNKV